MRDLRSITEALPAKLGITTPPVHDVAARAQLLRRRRRGLSASALLLVLGLLAVPLQASSEGEPEHLRVAGDGVPTTVTLPDLPIGGSSTTSTSTSSTSTTMAGATTTTRPGGGSGSGGGGQSGSTPAVCRSEANKASDTGVTEDRIEVVTTSHRSGTGSSYLGTAYIGVQAVVNRVNAAGGVCGRRLELRYSDDPVAHTTAFAVVGPTMSTKLEQSIANGDADRSGMPVVGGAGLVKAQYSSGWAWPVGPSVAGAARSMAQHAFELGARTFGVVYDSQQTFGLEGKQALQQYVGELSGATLKASVGLPPGKPSYGAEANAFNEACGSSCDFVAMLLTPETANIYINSQTEESGRKKGFGKMLTGGAPMLFNERFARDCGKYCDGMLTWTGYLPPIGEHASNPDAARYVDAVKSVDPGIDANNQFLEGAYVGTELLVQALRAVGSNLTRERLQQALDDLTFRSGLVTDLDWGPTVPSQRVANTAVRAFRVQTASGSFVGFQDAGTGWRRDPHPGSFPS